MRKTKIYSLSTVKNSKVLSWTSIGHSNKDFHINTAWLIFFRSFAIFFQFRKVYNLSYGIWNQSRRDIIVTTNWKSVNVLHENCGILYPVNIYSAFWKALVVFSLTIWIGCKLHETSNTMNMHNILNSCLHWQLSVIWYTIRALHLFSMGSVVFASFKLTFRSRNYSLNCCYIVVETNKKNFTHKLFYFSTIHYSRSNHSHD